MAKKESAALERWYATTDFDAVIERQKKAVRGKPRGALWPLHAQRTLGVMLLAVGRTEEALRVLDEAAATVRYTGKSSPWAIASWCAAVAYWVRERRGDPLDGVTAAKLAKFREPAAHAAQDAQPELWTSRRAAKEIAEGWRKFEEGRRDDGSLAIDTMAFHLSEITFFRELGVLAPVHARKVPARAAREEEQRGEDEARASQVVLCERTRAGSGERGFVA